jgi:hypothetical protein
MCNATAAVSWARHREIALENPSALTGVQQGALTLAELIRWYSDTFETISKWQRSKHERARHHGAAHFDQQRIAQLLAQACQGMTDRRLRARQALSRARDAAVGHQDLECHQEVEVQVGQIDFILRATQWTMSAEHLRS